MRLLQGPSIQDVTTESPFGDEGMIEVVVRVVGEAEFFHHAARPHIHLGCKTYDLAPRKDYVRLRPTQRRRRTFRGEAMTPGRASESPTNFDARCKGGVPSRPREANATYELSRISALYGPQTTAEAPIILRSIDEFIGIDTGQCGREVKHDLRIGVECSEGVPVLLAPGTKFETGRVQSWDVAYGVEVTVCSGR